MKLKIFILLTTIVTLSLLVVRLVFSPNTSIKERSKYKALGVIYHEKVKNKAHLKLSKNYANEIVFNEGQQVKMTDVSCSCAHIEMHHDTAVVNWQEPFNKELSPLFSILLVRFDSSLYELDAHFEDTDYPVRYEISHDKLTDKPLVNLTALNEPVQISKKSATGFQLTNDVEVFYDSLGHNSVVFDPRGNVLFVKAIEPFEGARILKFEDGKKQFSVKVTYTDSPKNIFYYLAETSTILSR